MTLSLCMIVKNEAAALPAFLEATAGCWDELCVVDTGSTDGTQELLRQAGARVEEAAWTADFAAARNQSLGMATGEWVLVLDPDELPLPGFAEALRAALTDAVGAVWIPFRNLLEGGHHRDVELLRCFRREGARYEHRIHEDAGRSVHETMRAEGRHAHHLESGVVHHGYLRAHAAHKEQRDRELLQRAIEEQPEDLYLRFKLLEQARYWKDEELAQRAARETAPLLDARGAGEAAWAGELVTLVVDGLGGSAEERLAAMDRWPSPPGAARELRRGELLEAMGRSSEAEAAFRACLSLPDATGQRSSCRPKLGLARIALGAGRLLEARTLSDEVLVETPRDPEALFASLALRDEAARSALVADLLHLAGPSEELARTLDAVGSSGLAKQVREALRALA